jgi:hypothetical protein
MIILSSCHNKKMSQIKSFAIKGDLHKARVVAKQVATLRQASDRNFESATMIATRAQVRKACGVKLFLH